MEGATNLTVLGGLTLCACRKGGMSTAPLRIVLFRCYEEVEDQGRDMTYTSFVRIEEADGKLRATGGHFSNDRDRDTWIDGMMAAFRIAGVQAEIVHDDE